MAAVGRRLLDGHSLRNRRTPRTHVPIGTNAINDRTIGESAQGLADYVRQQLGDTASLSCAIAYDTRHRSRHFAELCAGIMVAAGFQVYFLDGFRSTPELSFLVRFKQCSCGIMVTASHNPPSDNAVKVYWSSGGQVLPPHDQAIIDRVLHVVEIGQSDFNTAVERGRVILCGQEIDEAFFNQLQRQSFGGPRDCESDLLASAWRGSLGRLPRPAEGRLQGRGTLRTSCPTER